MPFLVNTSRAQTGAPKLSGLAVETLLNSGPSDQKIDLVFCGDGYMRSERKRLTSVVNVMIKELFSNSPFKELKSEFNVHVVHLDAPAGGYENGRKVGSYPIGSSKRAGDPSDIIYLEHSSRVKTVVANAPACDVPVVVTTMVGRSHSGNPVVMSESDTHALTHEFGHLLGNLGDEYTSSTLLSDRDNRPLPTKGDLPYVNLTLTAYIDPSSQESIKKTAKWAHFLDLPDGQVVSAFQGGYYRVMDVWRPTNFCVMALGRYGGFCPVCHEQLYKSILTRTKKPFDHDAYHKAFPLKKWAGGLR